MKNITWADFAPFKPCYNPEEKYGPWQGIMLELLQRQDIPADDRIWAFCTGAHWDENEREKNVRLFACACVRKTPIKNGKQVWDLLKDERSRNAIIVAEKFAMGEATKEELDAALDAARDAAGAAAWYAARDAARDAQIQIAIEFLTGPADTGEPTI